MLKKTITFKDLDGDDVTEDFYFGLNKAEITEMEFSQQGGLGDYLKSVIATGDGSQIMAVFKRVILSTVGRRSPDGRRFIKNQDIIDDFVQSEAYSTLFMELVTDADKATEFIRGVMPADLQDKITVDGTTELSLPEAEIPAWIREDRDPTPEEVQKMSPAELKLAFQRKSQS